MTTLVLSIFDRVKQNKIVKESLDLVGIVSEVYQIYKTDLKQTTPTSSAKPIEEVYFQACSSITHQKDEDIKSRPDYRAIEFSAKNLREARAHSSQNLQKVNQKVTEIKAKVSKAAGNAKEIAQVKIDSAKTRFNFVKNRASVVAKNIQYEVQQSARHSYERLAELVANILNSNFVSDSYANLTKNIARLKEAIGFSLLMAKNITLDLIQNCASKLNASDLYNSARKTVSSEVSNIKQVFQYIQTTIRKNEESLQSLRKYTGDYNSNSIAKNKKLIYLLFLENWKMVKCFFGNLDFEIFYSPKDSFKVVEDATIIWKMVRGETAAPNATTIEVVDQ